MKNYYMSITDYSEIRFLTGDITERENPEEMLRENGFLTDKGKPDGAAVAELNKRLTSGLISRISSKLQNRRNGIKPIADTYLKMYSDKDFSGMYLLTVFLYGFAGWQTPFELNLLSSRGELLKIYFGEFVRTLEETERSADYEDESE